MQGAAAAPDQDEDPARVLGLAPKAGIQDQYRHRDRSVEADRRKATEPMHVPEGDHRGAPAEPQLLAAVTGPLQVHADGPLVRR